MFSREFLVVKNKIYTVKNPNLTSKWVERNHESALSEESCLPADEEMKGSMIDSRPLDQIYDSIKKALKQSLKN